MAKSPWGGECSPGCCAEGPPRRGGIGGRRWRPGRPPGGSPAVNHLRTTPARPRPDRVRVAADGGLRVFAPPRPSNRRSSPLACGARQQVSRSFRSSLLRGRDHAGMAPIRPPGAGTGMESRSPARWRGPGSSRRPDRERPIRHQPLGRHHPRVRAQPPTRKRRRPRTPRFRGWTGTTTAAGAPAVRSGPGRSAPARPGGAESAALGQDPR